MAGLFDDLMRGLDEVESYLLGNAASHRVVHPKESDLKSASEEEDTTANKEAAH